MSEPQWLLWARQLQSIAQTGLTFAANAYDIERDTIPAALSTGRTLPHQIERMFAHHADPDLPVDYD